MIITDKKDLTKMSNFFFAIIRSSFSFDFLLLFSIEVTATRIKAIIAHAVRSLLIKINSSDIASSKYGNKLNEELFLAIVKTSLFLNIYPLVI